MSDYIQSDGYFPYIPFEYMRERRQGMLLFDNNYPIDYDKIMSHKVDFAYTLVATNYGDTVAEDNLIITPQYDNGSGGLKYEALTELLTRGLSVGFGVQLYPWYQTSAWDDATAEIMGIEFGDFLAELREAGGFVPTEMIPMFSIIDDGGWTTAVSAVEFKAYVDAFKAGFLYSCDTNNLPYDKLIIRLNSDNPNTDITGTLNLVDDFPLLWANGGFTEEYKSATAGTTYPTAQFATHSGYTKPALHGYVEGDTSALRTEYGMGGGKARLIYINEEFVKDVYVSDLQLPKKLNLYILDEWFSSLGILSNNEISGKTSFMAERQTNIEGLDTLTGTVYKGDLFKYISVGNYLMLYDYDMKPVVFEIIETSCNLNEKSFSAENFSNTLKEDIITHVEAGMGLSSVGDHITACLNNNTNDTWELGDVIGIFDDDTKYIGLDDVSNLLSEHKFIAGSINSTTGVHQADANYVVSEEFFNIDKQSCDYFVSNRTPNVPGYNKIILYFYDEDKTYLGSSYLEEFPAAVSGSFTMNYKAKYGKIAIYDTAQSLTKSAMLTHITFKGKSMKTFLDAVAKTYDCHFRYRYVVEETDVWDSFIVTKNYIDVYKNIGNTNKSSIFVDGGNVGNVNVSERKDELYTAVVPFSDSVNYIDWVQYQYDDGEFYKVADQPYMYSSSSYYKHSKPNNSGGLDHRVGIADYNDATTNLELFNMAKEFLVSHGGTKEEHTLDATVSSPTYFDYPKAGNTTSLTISGYEKKVRTDITKIRYVRNKINGSNVNGTSVFNEIRAYDKQGVNRAYGKTVTAQHYTGGAWVSLPTPAYSSPTGATDYSYITDNSPSTWIIPSLTYTSQRITVDLGALFEIDSIQMIHYYADNRQFKENVLTVSADGTNWYELFDSDKHGEYPETGEGTLLVANDRELRSDKITYPISLTNVGYPYPSTITMPYTYNVVFFHTFSTVTSAPFYEFWSSDVPIHIQAETSVTYTCDGVSRVAYHIGTYEDGNWQRRVVRPSDGYVETALSQSGTTMFSKSDNAQGFIINNDYDIYSTVNSDTILINEVQNGDFSDGTTGWLTVNSTHSVTDNVLTFTATSASGFVYQNIADIAGLGDKLFMYASVKANSANVNMLYNDGTAGSNRVYHTGSGNYEDLYLKLTTVNNTGSYLYFIDSSSSGWQPVYIDGTVGVFVINMTELGIESYSEQRMLALCKQGYFEEYKVFGKYVMEREDMFLPVTYTEYHNEKVIPVPYDHIGNVEGFVYTSEPVDVVISNVNYKLHDPTNIGVTFGDVQKDITDNI